MRRIAWPVALFVSASILAMAQDSRTVAAESNAVPTYRVGRAQAPLAIDGELDTAWQKAAAITLLFPWEKQSGAKQKTEARILWDDRYLYVFYACEDEDIVALFTNRDDPTYRDDAVEIFINPRPEQEGTYYGLEMNAGAVLYDYVAVMPRFFFKRFQMNGVQLAVHVRGTRNVRGNQDQGWNLELAIPWENFEILGKKPQAGERWRAQLNRWDGVEPDRRLSMWVNPQIENSWPHVPSRFGWLEFTD
ncbi:MAG: carbohydrate-binding family 9-like protein [Bryobacterales bacterium]|nr:carbohydrate-binding family 9-like protein [Bryobacterales bacterium]